MSHDWKSFGCRPSHFLTTLLAVLVLCTRADDSVKAWVSGIDWPEPKVVDPGPPGGPPADAIVLFDGKDLSAWEGAEKWTIRDGYAICGSDISTKQAFGDCQLHLEYLVPTDVQGEDQGRCNSGVILMGRYEVQILDSYHNKTYFDGQAGSVYKQRPPLVNACRKPGEWQSYDIVFNVPHFDAKGHLLQPAYITLLHNGILAQNHFELLGISSYSHPPHYGPHRDKLPLHIQFHGDPIRFRNIWIRPLEDDHSSLLVPLREKLKSGTHGG